MSGQKSLLVCILLLFPAALMANSAEDLGNGDAVECMDIWEQDFYSEADGGDLDACNTQEVTRKCQSCVEASRKLTLNP